MRSVRSATAAGIALISFLFPGRSTTTWVARDRSLDRDIRWATYWPKYEPNATPFAHLDLDRTRESLLVELGIRGD